MSLTRAKVKSAIKKSIVKKLLILGFEARKDSLGAYRIRGEFVDVVSIQIGRTPGSLYLHFFSNLVADPFTNLLSSITLGKRLMGNENGGMSWIADQELELATMLDKIWQAVEECALPFFESLQDICDYERELEVAQEGRPYPLALALTYAKTKNFQNAKSLLLNLRERLISSESYDFEGNDEDIILLKNLDKLIKGVQEGSVDKLLDSWERQNLKALSGK